MFNENSRAAKRIADQAAMQNMLNCYLRETGDGLIYAAGELPAEDSLRPEYRFLAGLKGGAAAVAAGAAGTLVCRLAKQNVTLLAGVDYYSPTGRHRFDFPIYYLPGTGDGADADSATEADYVTLIALLGKELSLSANEGASTDELMLRAIQSCRNVESFVQARLEAEQQMKSKQQSQPMDFIAAEQSLLYGHLLHPTPKSRQGIPEEQNAIYSPELQGAFPLHYFRAHRSIVLEDSALGLSATELIKRDLRGDSSVSAEWLEQFASAEDWSLVPVHPLQAEQLRKQQPVQDAIAHGLLQDLGAIGRSFMATSSLRTIYHPDAQFMYKCSIPVKVTNSLRVNKYKELERGVEVHRLMGTEIGGICNRFAGFDIVADPAFITLRFEGQEDEESGFELVLRDNPFRGELAEGAVMVAALVQDPLPGGETLLAHSIRAIAKREGRSEAEVSLDWFNRYLKLSLEPMVWLYQQWGIALEAHQQNSVVRLKDGYPVHYYFRDNQGYYFCKSTEQTLEKLLPGIGSKSLTVCEDAVADERFRYYMVLNHMFGLINGFGYAGLASESLLLAKLREALEAFVPMNREPSIFLKSLLEWDHLPCKANLLTRLYDMDELVGSLEAQSVYVSIPNPLVKEVPQLAGRF
ncbi:N(2)-citryl-N(6)-acetyl-N(6)-hydroxylysine synthase [Paenibacillus plantiphilus]|uniref:N(2)-citryl-N(6)-acetyl-N(6)-hydroxylysine synthase n=1 Tax=Paenibacillus plantiphilus TaxID=2905650 RepID=A0ABN8GV42_9BACL|nr:IucA/IucC family protein [Paenibacillus plantiphilus]CAH1218680.1 N(2)-citryl-N(6)-acetyl-N(6)-hydroxylysine synthase [Paenibacillus plantiphilus]